MSKAMLVVKGVIGLGLLFFFQDWPQGGRTALEARDVSDLITLNHDGFTLWLDCKKRATVCFYYEINEDVGCLKRHRQFYNDPQAPRPCQQTSLLPYRGPYDRGHLVPANHLDHTEQGIRESNFITNILPQHKNMNRGAWLATEEIAECWRDIDPPIQVWGGAIWSRGSPIISSHNVEIPTSFWKIIKRGGGAAIAWIIPNTELAHRKNLASFEVSVDDIKWKIGREVNINIGRYFVSKAWGIPKGCDKS